MRLDAHFDMLPEKAFQRGPSGSIMPQGGKGSTINAPAPDPSIGASQKEMSDLARQEYEDFKTNVWPVMQAQSQRQQNNADTQAALDLKTQNQQNAIANEQYQRYKDVYMPLQNDIIKQANEYDTGANRERIANEAMGDVASQAQIGRQNTARTMASYGINPSSGSYVSNQNANDVMEAATKASAATRARDAAVQLGWAKKMDAIGLGSGVFGNQATSTGLALNAGNQSLQSGQVPISNSQALGASYNAGYGGTMQGWNNVGQLGAQSYSSQISAYNAQQAANAQSSSGIGAAIGGIGGALMSGGTGGFAKSAIGMGLNKLFG
jgi:hypothetical protein